MELFLGVALSVDGTVPVMIQNVCWSHWMVCDMTGSIVDGLVVAVATICHTDHSDLHISSSLLEIDNYIHGYTSLNQNSHVLFLLHIRSGKRFEAPSDQGMPSFLSVEVNSEFN